MGQFAVFRKNTDGKAVGVPPIYVAGISQCERGTQIDVVIAGVKMVYHVAEEFAAVEKGLTDVLERTLAAAVLNVQEPTTLRAIERNVVAGLQTAMMARVDERVRAVAPVEVDRVLREAVDADAAANVDAPAAVKKKK